MAASDAAIVGAIISSSIAVVVAIGTQIWISVRSRTDRQYLSRRAGLIEAQDALLELRDALAAYGLGLRSDGADVVVSGDPSAGPQGDPLEAGRRAATGRFLACAARVHDDAVFAAMTTWRSAAERRFVSVAEVTAAVEQEWFEYVHALCRAALTSSTGSTSRQQRASVTAPPPLARD